MRYGYFDNEKCEYVIERVDTPMSWTNYIGTENLVGVFNQTAGGYLFCKSAEYHRITRFRGNAVPADRPGHYVYLRDDETGDYWSISWQPVVKPVECYRARHGLSYSMYSCEYSGIYAEQRLFIPKGSASKEGGDVELWDIKIENRSGKLRKISVFSYAELSWHQIDGDNKNFQCTLYCAGASYKDGVIEQELHYEQNSFQFFTADFDPDGFEIERERFTGIWRSENNPEAVEKGELAGRTAWQGGNQCAALHKKLSLNAGQNSRLCFMLGEGNREAGLAMRKKFASPQARDEALAALAAYWREKQSHLQINTPDADMNTMLNIWTLYQSEINVMFSRFASFIEVGGRTGLGFRDTSQDAMCVVPSNPAKCRERLVQILRALVSEGYGLHLFEPEWFEEKSECGYKSPTIIPGAGRKPIIHGIDQACSDDALWLVSSITEYVRETGDAAFADLVLPYADNAPPDSVYEHCKKILSFSERMTGSHGICQGLKADWNDCLNLGGGESAMVSYLYLWALDNFIKLAEFLGKTEDAAQFRQAHEKTAKICRETLWDGKWYLRGFTKTGRPIGTNADKEGKVHLESNAWAVIASGDDHERGRQAMDSVEEYLGTPYGLMLNAPAYTVIDDDVGFVTRVYPGLKENGAIFSHPNPWAWVAECILGRGDRAMDLYKRLCPAAWNDKCEVRKAEPYSTCQFITGKNHPAFGEAHHPFMTGSGGWSYFAATQFILGIRPEFNYLVIDPCIPPEWDGFTAIRRFRGGEYRIKVKNPRHICKGVTKILFNGEECAIIPIIKNGESCEVEVILG